MLDGRVTMTEADGRVHYVGPVSFDVDEPVAVCESETEILSSGYGSGSGEEQMK